MGFVGVQVAAVVAAAAGLDLESTAVLFCLAIPMQYVAIVAGAVAVSRVKGLGSLAADFGLRIRRADWPALVMGCALQIVALVLLAPIFRVAALKHEPQQLVERTKQVHSLPLIVVIVLATAIGAPVVEELIFRGMLLRGLLRRTSDAWAVVISALLFAAAHLLDLGAGYVFPALFGLGLVLGVLAIRDRSLSRPILIHGGFNLLATVLTLIHV
jgi:membrane protease YdiL (CAAX protease family)